MPTLQVTANLQGTFKQNMLPCVPIIITLEELSPRKLLFKAFHMCNPSTHNYQYLTIFDQVES